MTEWRDHAKCLGADTDIFFDENRVKEARIFCDNCPVQAECLDEAMWTRSWGTWGGTTIRQRRDRTYSAHEYIDPSRQIQISRS